MEEFGWFNLHKWVVDWDKINSLDDLKEVLKNVNLRIYPSEQSFQDIRQFCKFIRCDGTECDPETLEPVTKNAS